MFGQEILPICLNFLSSTNAFVLEITCVFLRLSTPWVLSIKSFQLCVFIKIELLWLSYDKICWSTNLRPLSWVATSWWTLSASRHWWRAFLFFSRSFCVWNHQKEFYVQNFWSGLDFRSPFTRNTCEFNPIDGEGPTFFGPIHVNIESGEGLLLGQAGLPDSLHRGRHEVQSEDLQGQRWWDEVSSLSNRCFAGSVSALVANVKIILWGNLLYIHTSDHEEKRHAMLSDI